MRGMIQPAPTGTWLVVVAVSTVFFITGCDLLTVSQTGRNIREGNAAVMRGEFQKAVQYYETALDGTMLSAEAHYRLGLVYEDHLKNQVAALHHFERYLELAPQGQYSKDVKGYVDRLRLVIVSSLADGAVLPAKEGTRLKNENLDLRKQIAELRQRTSPGSRPAPTPSPAPPAVASTPTSFASGTPPPLPVEATPPPDMPIRRAVPVEAPSEMRTVQSAPPAPATTPAALEPPAEAQEQPAATPASPPLPRTHTVVKGDTLAGLAKRYYKSASQWPKIAEANKEILPDPTKMQVGMVLKIPPQ